MKFRATGAVAACVLVVAGCSDSGEQLTFGEKATVSAERGGTLDVTVLRIDEGSNSDLTALENASQYTGDTPYYVHYEIAKTEGSHDTLWESFVVSAGGERLTELNVMAAVDFSDPFRPTVKEFDRCTAADMTEFEKAAKGQSVEGCAIFLADKGIGAPTTVQWALDDADKPLATWRRS